MIDQSDTNFAAGDNPADILDQIENTLTLQIEHAQNDNYHSATTLLPEVSNLLDRINSFPPAVLANHNDTISRIQQLHSSINLLLALQKQDYSKKRNKMMAGKKVLNAYGR